jgi:hypothetical protein
LYWPAYFGADLFGVQFHAIQHDARGLDDIVSNSITGHPRNFVFGHGRDSIEERCGLQVSADFIRGAPVLAERFLCYAIQVRSLL